MTAYASGKYALGECDRCGLTWKLRELNKLTINNTQVSIKVCPDCWEPDHPQNQTGKRVVFDPQALHEPRPDSRSADMTNTRWGWRPVYGIEAVGQLGTVTVTT